MMKMKTLKQIMAARPEVAKLVMERFPRTKLERQGCVMEKSMRDAARFAYAKKLMNNPQVSKVEYKS